MGLNLITYCEKHKVYNYSMRGEEAFDFQRIMRSEHRECMSEGYVQVVCDADTNINDESVSGYAPMWPYEERPALIGIEPIPEEFKKAALVCSVPGCGFGVTVGGTEGWKENLGFSVESVVCPDHGRTMQTGILDSRKLWR